MRSLLLALLVSSTLFGASCDNEKERITWIRERLYPDATPQQLTRLLSALKMSTNSCPDSGDLWYYRSLIEARLNKGKVDAYTANEVQRLDSEAKRVGLNPIEPPPRPVAIKANGPVRQKWALIVGIQTFSDAARIPQLRHSVADARKLEAWLKGPQGRFPAGNVKVLVDAEAKAPAIREALGDIRAQAQPDDLVLIYLSTHGLPASDDPTGVSFVVTHDTDLSTPGKSFATSLAMVELRDFSQMLRAQRFVLILDTCFAGGATSDGSRAIRPVNSSAVASFTGALQGIQSGSGRAILAASRATEKSWESARLKHGFFTHYLVESLSQNDGLGKLSVVYSALKDQVLQAVQAEVNATQTPVFDFTQQGDQIIIGVPAGSSGSSGGK